MTVDELREVADEYFGEQGLCTMLQDEFNSSPEFLAGQCRGHADARAVLHGVADWEEDNR